MSLMEMVLNAQGGQGLGRLAQEFGLDVEKAGGLVEVFAPAIARGVKDRARRGGLDTVLGELQGEEQGAFMDDPAAAAAPAGRAQGQRFLDRILGSRAASEVLAADAANRTGADVRSAAQFLPAIAAMLQGGMQRSVPDSAIPGILSQAGYGGSENGIVGVVYDIMGSGRFHAARSGLDALTRMLDADGTARDDGLGGALRRRPAGGDAHRASYSGWSSGRAEVVAEARSGKAY